MSNSNVVKFKDKKGNSYPYLFIDLKTGIFQVRKWVPALGITKSLSLETTDFNAARKVLADKIVEISKEKPTQKKQNKIFKDFYEMMIRQKVAEGTKPVTLKRIKNVWDYSLAPFWEYVLPEDINQERVTEFITWHKRKRPGIQFINAFKYLGNIFSVMVESEAMAISKKPKLEIPKDEQKHHAKQKGRYITDSEVSEILKQADKVTRLQILMAFSTGMRKMEIGALELKRLKKVKDIFIAVLDTSDTKTGLAREVPFPKSLTPLIEAQINDRANYLFPMKRDLKRNMSSQLIDKGWFAAKKLANIHGRMRFHDLRHTCATNMARMNINPVVAVTMLGMSLVTYQKVYLKLTASDLIIASEANSERLPKVSFQ